MYFLFFILMLAALFIYLLFSKPMEIDASFSSDTMSAQIRAVWLSLIKIKALATEAGLRISLSILGKVFSREKSGSIEHLDLGAIQSVVHVQYSRIELHYSLNEPELMGLLSGAVGTFGSLYGINELRLYPSFIAPQPYFLIRAHLQVNMGKTLAGFLRHKINTMKTNRRKAWTVPT